MLKHLPTLLVFSLTCQPAHAETSAFRVWGSPWLYSLPDTEYDKPFQGSLADGTMIVHVFTTATTATSASAIDKESGKIIVKGEQITLCYKRKEVIYPPGAPIPALLYSQALEYTIAGLPKRKYSFRISLQCK